MSNALVVRSVAEIALQAKMYARYYILEGTTQLINNTYDLDKKQHIERQLSRIRNPLTQYPEYPGLTLEIDREISKFYRTIDDCKNLAVGNCHELALMALDYVAHHTPHVDAEVYCIAGGDHVFLVVGRNKGSDPGQPTMWGDDAYICDPWSDMAYPASEYLAKTKNFYRTYGGIGGYTNHVQDFDPLRHSFKPIATQDTIYIRKTQSEDHLLMVQTLFHSKVKLILTATEKLQRNLEKISNRLLTLYGESDEKYIILSTMVRDLRVISSFILEDLKDINFKESYSTLRSTLEKKLTTNVTLLDCTTDLSDKNQQTLRKYKNEDSLFTKIMQYFKIETKTVRDMYETGKKYGALMGKIKNK